MLSRLGMTFFTIALIAMFVLESIDTRFAVLSGGLVIASANSNFKIIFVLMLLLLLEIKFDFNLESIN